MDQIDTRTYHEYTIDETYFFQDCTYTRGNKTILTCSGLFERQYIQMIFFIFLCENSTGIYHYKILRIITQIYHMDIDDALYNLVYNKTSSFLYEHQLLSATIGKWDDNYKSTSIFRS